MTDNDNDLDLYVARGWVLDRAGDRLLRNDQGRFTDVTLAAGLTDSLPSGRCHLVRLRPGWLAGHLRGSLAVFEDAPDLRQPVAIKATAPLPRSRKRLG